MKQQRIFQTLRITVFMLVMLAGCVIGFMIFLRPSGMSEAENRDLAEFPKAPDFLDVVSVPQGDGTEKLHMEWHPEEFDRFLSGQYTTDIGVWYSDTFPFRDELITLNGKLRGLYGIKTQTASSDGVGDTIETGGDFVWDTTPSEPLEPAESSQPSETSEESDSESNADTSPVTEPETIPPGSVDHEVIKGYLVDGIRGYELYYFNRQNSNRYARAVVQTALNVEGRAQVYVMVTPMSYAYGVSEKTQKELNVSNCKDAIDWMYNAIEQYGKSAQLSTPVIPIDAYSALAPHKDEYIFFRTDHHWTALGAHYASRAFLDRVGRSYPALKEYEKLEFSGFTGSLAGHTKHENPALANNPDTIEAYVPLTVKTVTLTDRDGSILERPIVNPDAMTTFSASQRYRCFVDGDYPLSVVHNPSVGDGSTVLIIKESYGNAFIPMLVDSYEYVYAIDYRYFRAMSISDVVATYGIDTILFLNNPVATSADSNIRGLENLLAIQSKIEP